MHLAFAALLSLWCQDDPDLGPVRTVDVYDFSVRAPRGWREGAGLPPLLVRYLAPAGGPAGGEIDLLFQDVREPWPVKLMADDVRAGFARDYPGHSLTLDEDIRIGGRPGHLMVIRAKAKDGREFVQATAFVSRNLSDYHVFHGRSDPKDADRIVALLRKILASVVFGLPVSKEGADGLAKLLEATRAGGPRPLLAGEAYQIVRVRDRKLGYQRQLVREERQEGRPGYAFETESVMTYDDGRGRDASRGGFALDGSWQRAESEQTLEDAKRGKRVHKETITLRGCDAVVVRDLNGARSEAKFRVPDGTYLTDAADIVRRWLALGGKAVCAMYVLPAFADEPRLELLEVAAAEPMKTDAGERELIAVFTRTVRARGQQYFYEKDGAIHRIASGRSVLQILHSSREEATK